VEFYTGRFQKALEMLEVIETPIFDEPSSLYIPKDLFYGVIYTETGNKLLAQKHLEISKQILSDSLKIRTADFRLYQSLSLTYAYLGEKSKAIENSDKAAELVKNHYIDVYFNKVRRTETLMVLGEYDPAIAEIREILSADSHYSPAYFRAVFYYKPLLGMSQFEEVLEEFEE